MLFTPPFFLFLKRLLINAVVFFLEAGALQIHLHGSLQGLGLSCRCLVAAGDRA